MSNESDDAGRDHRQTDSTHRADRRTVLKTTGALAGGAAGAWPVSAAAEDDGGSADSTDEEPTYEPTWESLERHDVPDWYHDGKLGIFLHWGAYSVTGQTEWYVEHLLSGDEDIVDFHEEHYGPVDEYPYRDFLRKTDAADDPDVDETLTADEWDPDRWAGFFEAAGARYVVLTAEHCDGIPLWNPDAQPHDWNTVTRGPERDLVADLGDAVRDRGLRFGVSEHSMLNWYEPEAAPFELYGHPAYDPDGPTDEYVREWRAKIYELLEHSRPDLLWLDGDWMAPAETWGTKEIVADYYNAAADEWDADVAVNDRLGHTRGERGDFATLETTLDSYDPPEVILADKYEATGNLNPDSWGWDRNATSEDVPDAADLVRQLVGTVSTNGNLLIGLGPKANGVIPEVQAKPVRGLGEWLDTNGEAIYGTRYWVKPVDEVSDVEVRYTVKNNHVYAIALEWPGDTVRLDVPRYVDLEPGYAVEMLGVSRGEGTNEKLDWRVDGETLVVDLPDRRPEGEHAQHAYALKIQVARPDENAFENAATDAEESKIVRSQERMREIIQGPDLTVTELTTGLESEDVRTLSATVENQGFVETPATTVRFENATNGTAIATAEVPGLDPDESAAATVEWNVDGLSSGVAYELEAIVDPRDEIDELEETNNSATTEYRLLESLPDEFETAASTEAEFGTWDGNLAVSANGEDVWDDVDEYGALYDPERSAESTATATVKVVSQEDTDDWAKAGLMIRNDVAAAGESPGYALIAVTPENDFEAEWDTDGDGYVNESDNAGETAYPCWLRLERDGATFTGYYSTDGETWTAVGSREVPDVADVQDVAMFVTSHDSDERSTVEFDEFAVTSE